MNERTRSWTRRTSAALIGAQAGVRDTATRMSTQDLSSPSIVTTMTADLNASALVLVEGISDRIALETLASRRGRDLGVEGVSVVAIGGAQALTKVLREIRAQRPEIGLAGLCDAGEEPGYRRALERAGLGSHLTRESMEELGFYVCEPDLEGELIRALGVARVEEVLERNGNLSSFRIFQKQPQWRGRPTEDQLRRFLGSSAGKIKYARPLVEALDLTRVPRPFDAALARV